METTLASCLNLPDHFREMATTRILSGPHSVAMCLVKCIWQIFDIE